MRRIPKPYVTFSVIVICVAVWAMIGIIQVGNPVENAIALGAWYKPMVLAGEYWRFLTAGFTHVTVMHLMVNMWSLYMMGRVIEPMLGRLRFAFILMVSIMGGSLFLFASKGNTPAVGISGGLYGLMSAYLCMLAMSGALKNPYIRRNVMSMVLLNLVINLMPNVSVQAHLGGAGFGLLALIATEKTAALKDMSIHALVAAILLTVSCTFIAARNSGIRTDETYIGTDIKILKFEKSLGFDKHVDKVAERLPAVYGQEDGMLDFLKGE